MALFFSLLPVGFWSFLVLSQELVKAMVFGDIPANGFLIVERGVLMSGDSCNALLFCLSAIGVAKTLILLFGNAAKSSLLAASVHVFGVDGALNGKWSPNFQVFDGWLTFLLMRTLLAGIGLVFAAMEVGGIGVSSGSLTRPMEVSTGLRPIIEAEP